MKKIHMILALDSKNWLWKDGDLAWRIREDMKYFKKITTSSHSVSPLGERGNTNCFSSPSKERLGEGEKQNAVIMGRKTWDSIPEKYKPLPGRINAILSRSYTPEDDYGHICKYSSFERAVEKLSSREDVADIFIIWGAQIYNLALKSETLETLYLTRVEWDYDCDVFMDIDFSQFEVVNLWEWQENKKRIKFRFEVYKRK